MAEGDSKERGGEAVEGLSQGPEEQARDRERGEGGVGVGGQDRGGDEGERGGGEESERIRVKQSWETTPSALFSDDVSDLPADHPDMLAMQSLMEETPEERAEWLKEQGNLTLKEGKSEKKLRSALALYTAAIDLDAGTNQNRSIYFSNRSHVQILLGNLGRAFADAERAAELDPSNVKAHFRAAKAARALGNADSALTHLNAALRLDASNVDVKKMKGEVEEEERRREAARTRSREIRSRAESLTAAIIKRGILIGPPSFTEYSANLSPWLDSSSLLHWPVLLLYPEHMTVDVVQDFCECDLIAAHLRRIFDPSAPPPPWDSERHYRFDSVEVYVQTNAARPLPRARCLASFLQDKAGLIEEDLSAMNLDTDDEKEDAQDWTEQGKQEWVRLDFKKTLANVLTLSHHVVPRIPIFYVISKETPFHYVFLSGQWSPP